MKTNLKPNIYVKDIFSINYEKLKNQGIKTLLFDIDNTIATTKEKYPNNKVKELFNSLKKDNFNVYIISNTLKHRALRFGEALDVKTYYFSAKPLKRQYIRIMENHNTKREEIAAIGDQIYTDIKGANNLNITSILVDQISPQESIISKFNRIKENKLIKETKIIEKGKYYE